MARKRPLCQYTKNCTRPKNFFKIKPGLWALKSHEKKIKKQFLVSDDSEEKGLKVDTFSHSYYQGLLVEIGNIQGFNTYVPVQDKNKTFLETPLHKIVTLHKLPDFTYPDTLRFFSTIDILWINNRGFPSYAFEVEHTTSFQNSLLKFTECQDFNVSFSIISSPKRKEEFHDKISRHAFNEIKKRVKFIDYDQLADLHSSVYKMKQLELQPKLN